MLTKIPSLFMMLCALSFLLSTNSVSQQIPIPFVKPINITEHYVRDSNQPIPHKKPDLYSPFGSQYAYALTKPDRIIFVKAMEAAKGNAQKAIKIAGKARDPIISKIVMWIILQRRESNISFATRRKFIENNPNWPNMEKIIQYSEYFVVASGLPPQNLINWFQKYKPVTATGLTSLANAFAAQKEIEQHLYYIEKAWILGTFNRADELVFITNNGRYLDHDAHAARLNRLLWDSHVASAKRMLKRVNTKTKRLAEARIALINSSYGVDRTIMRVSDELRQDPGLTYNRLRWRRIRGRFDNAINLLTKQKDLQKTSEYSRLWWKESHILARYALNNNRYREAYNIVSNHTATDALSVFEAEWLAGFIQLRFLDNPDVALQHFYRVYDAVSYPVSLSRGAYWIGRALEAGDQMDIAISWYAKGAEYGATYYGQLALQKLNPKAKELISPTPQPTIKDRSLFEQDDLPRALTVLLESGKPKYLRSFAIASGSNTDNRAYPMLTAELLANSKRIDLGVWVARRSAQKHITLLNHGYPNPRFINPQYSEKALVLAVIRQESNFDSNAISRAGARGLMQLMPATAKAVSRQIRERYNKQNLIEEPSYNVRLGDRYLFSLNKRFKTSYAMAIAGYNAGPHRVQRWVKRFGDPRKPEVDIIDWIERIPFTETRNYVQRVLENIIIYRKKINPNADLRELMRPSLIKY